MRLSIDDSSAYFDKTHQKPNDKAWTQLRKEIDKESIECQFNKMQKIDSEAASWFFREVMKGFLLSPRASMQEIENKYSSEQMTRLENIITELGRRSDCYGNAVMKRANELRKIGVDPHKIPR
ncbi:hypothetical protein [Hahella ganghwensis]|uniref:hypothetical protein n=1 Tax=Hahella ganghwensis TaxID=286420 RepID=UPI00036B26F8|nr:hypothetical protein [Hahella ganghwensis]